MNTAITVAIPENLPQPTAECAAGIIPLEMSMGGINAFYFYSAATEQRTSYAVALHSNLAIREGRHHDDTRKICREADAMREIEKQAGRALYFEDRREILKALAEKSNAPSEVVKYGRRTSVSQGPLPTRKVSQDEVNKFSESLRDKPAPAKTPSTEIDASKIKTNILGDAINSMMKE